VVSEGRGVGSLGLEISLRKKTVFHIGVEIVIINRSTNAQIEKIIAGTMADGKPRLAMDAKQKGRKCVEKRWE
jgi:hypothetical protein